jgi:glycerophosphoryl diester phosphodiesterase
MGRNRRPLVIGHRGASALCVENTIAAFRRARADGADGVELDVLLCRGDEVVVCHDEDLDRLAGRRVRVADLPWAELRTVELRGGGSIPLLDEVLEELGPLLVNVEIKAARPLSAGMFRLARRVASVLARHDVGDRALVSSFNPFALGAIRVLAPGIPTGLLFHGRLRAPLREAWARRLLRPTALHPEHTLVDKRTLAGWHAEGYAVNTWTVDDADELRRLARLGVDGVITNDPAAARQALL